jgi:DNA-binding SARP family transcriptional activator
MKFHILGPLEVIADTGPVHLEAPSLRCLLLALLSHPNDLVCVDRLQEWLWPAEVPRSAVATLQARVSVLRRLLEPDRPPWSKPRVLITRSPGYLIRVERDDLDSLAFESLLLRARAAQATGDYESVRGLLTDALALWRGDPLADVAFLEAAQPVVRRLEELRLSAIELRVEADLRLGRHFEVVADLVGLTSAHPVHEPYYAQLMVALYRCGRRADALGVYARAREVLSREMALEPGPVLRRLRKAIQADDVSGCMVG